MMTAQTWHGSTYGNMLGFSNSANGAADSDKSDFVGLTVTKEAAGQTFRFVVVCHHRALIEASQHLAQSAGLMVNPLSGAIITHDRQTAANILGMMMIFSIINNDIKQSITQFASMPSGMEASTLHQFQARMRRLADEQEAEERRLAQEQEREARRTLRHERRARRGTSRTNPMQ